MGGRKGTAPVRTGGDGPEEIAACLNCPLPDCTGKCALWTSKGKAKPKTSRRAWGYNKALPIPAGFEGACKAGGTVYDLAMKFQVSKSTITVWKRKLGLNKKSPSKGGEEGKTPRRFTDWGG